MRNRLPTYGRFSRPSRDLRASSGISGKKARARGLDPSFAARRRLAILEAADAEGGGVRGRGKPLLRMRCLLFPGRGGKGLETNLEPTSSTPWTPGRVALQSSARRLGRSSESSAGVWGGKSSLLQASWLLLTPVALPEGAGWPLVALSSALGLALLRPQGQCLGPPPSHSFSDPPPPKPAGKSAPSTPAAPSGKPGGPDQARMAITATVCRVPPTWSARSARRCPGQRPPGAAAGGGRSAPVPPGRLSGRGGGAAPARGAAVPRERVAASAPRGLGPRRPICHRRPSSSEACSRTQAFFFLVVLGPKDAAVFLPSTFSFVPLKNYKR